jgi:hypothetical protein
VLSDLVSVLVTMGLVVVIDECGDVPGGLTRQWTDPSDRDAIGEGH